MIAIQKIKTKRDEQTYQWWFINYCSEFTFKSPWICLLGFPSASDSLLQVIYQKKWQQALFIVFLKIRTRWASSSSPWRVDLSSSEGFCHVLSEFWTAFTRPGALLLALASCCSLWRVVACYGVCISFPLWCSLPLLALHSLWARPGELASIFLQIFIFCINSWD